jgi:hypothetical protein
MDVSSHPPAKRACSKQSKSASVSRLPYLVNKRLDARVRRAAAAYGRARLRLPDQLAAGSFIASAPSTRAKTGAEISTVVQFFSFFLAHSPRRTQQKVRCGHGRLLTVYWQEVGAALLVPQDISSVHKCTE